MNSNAHILFVDDDPDTRRLLKTLFEGEYDFSLAASLEEAWEALQGPTFDLLLLDIRLEEPDSGLRLLQEAREQKMVGEEIPAVALTTYATEGDRERLLESGFDAYVEKPFRRDELAETIDQVLLNN